jgi:L-threonylcarbamoyladenylate synthase
VTTTIPLDAAEAFDAAAEALEKGSVVVLPVGGVYAVVADAFRAAATQRIFAARRRSRTTPLPVVIRSERQVAGLASAVPEYADRLMAAYWPGDLTIILPVSDGMTWDLGNGKGTVQLRLPTDDLVLRLVGRVGPLACTAANRLDQPRPTTVADARQQLGVLVPVYLDGGELDGRISTIVDATGPSVVVHREGAIPELDVHLVAAGELAWGERPVAGFPVDPASPGAAAAELGTPADPAADDPAADDPAPDDPAPDDPPSDDPAPEDGAPEDEGGQSATAAR